MDMGDRAARKSIDPRLIPMALFSCLRGLRGTIRFLPFMIISLIRMSA